MLQAIVFGLPESPPQYQLRGIPFLSLCWSSPEILFHHLYLVCFSNLGDCFLFSHSAFKTTQHSLCADSTLPVLFWHPLLKLLSNVEGMLMGCQWTDSPILTSGIQLLETQGWGTRVEFQPPQHFEAVGGVTRHGLCPYLGPPDQPTLSSILCLGPFTGRSVLSQTAANAYNSGEQPPPTPLLVDETEKQLLYFLVVLTHTIQTSDNALYVHEADSKQVIRGRYKSNGYLHFLIKLMSYLTLNQWFKPCSSLKVARLVLSSLFN